MGMYLIGDCYNNRFDKAIFISGDGDFSQLVKYVRDKNKEVEMVSFEELASKNLINEVDRYIFINKKIANRFFWREIK